MKDLEFEARFQIGSTGISQDYFNNILTISDPDVIREPSRYYRDREFELREILAHNLKENNVLVTYTDYIKYVVERYNSPKHDFNGGLHTTSNPVSIDDFIDDINRDTVRELDRVVMAIKGLGEKPPEKLDLRQLLDLMYEASLLIYGSKYEERLKKRFYVGRK